MTVADIHHARELGYTIKLLVGMRRPAPLRVHPALVPLTHPLASFTRIYCHLY